MCLALLCTFSSLSLSFAREALKVRVLGARRGVGEFSFMCGKEARGNSSLAEANREVYLRWNHLACTKADDTFVTASATRRVYDKSVSSGVRANKRR